MDLVRQILKLKKYWNNLECQRNTVVGAAGWAINDGSDVSEEVLIKDNLWYHQEDGYQYLFEHYSGYTKNWTYLNLLQRELLMLIQKKQQKQIILLKNLVH